jgi:hypothetical protein
MRSKMSNIFKGIANIDRRYYYAGVFILTVILLLFPLGLPLAISPEVRHTYELVDSLEPGDLVIINFCLSASGYAQLQGACNSMIDHVFQKEGVLVIFTSTADQAPIMLEEIIANNGELMPGHTDYPYYQINGKQYGEDYVNMGYYPGLFKWIASLSADFRPALGNNDWYNIDVSDFFDSHNLNSAEDVDLVISFDSDDGAGDFMNYFFLEYGTPVVQSMIGVMVANSKVQYNAGNYAGIVPSIRGAAEYQYLANYPGYALTQMDAFSVVQFFLILLMVLGNIGYYGYTRLHKGE